jgi:predicted TIM-barrel fold metal-dependent hydrolase
MPLESQSIRRPQTADVEDLLIVDCDVHNAVDENVVPYLSQRWRDYRALVGEGSANRGAGVYSSARPFAARLDTYPPGGGSPGSDPDFAREQLLDEYGITAAVIGGHSKVMPGGRAPVQFEIDMARATNDYNYDWWLESDSRWLASITVAPDEPDQAVKEIVRCREKSDRYVQVLLNSVAERPQGNPAYWPIYEAAEAYGMPVAFHTAGLKYHASTGAGHSTFYYEHRTIVPLAAQVVISSMIFEGLFDRFPKLKIALIELGWDLAVPFGWRMDAAWRVMREEVSHLERKPSEYLRDHFWYTTQPAVEPENPPQLNEFYDWAAAEGALDRLMFSSDYPHWDMDSPFDAVPRRLPRELRRKILAGNAADLYGREFGDGAQ